MTTTTRSMKAGGQPSADGAKTGDKHKVEVESDSASKLRKKASKNDVKDSHDSATPAGDGEGTKISGKAGESKGAVEPNGRGNATASNILEKGIIYFFFRGRVDVDEPHSIQDIARSYIILRPIDKKAKLGEGPIGDAGNSRLCVIPKKTLPQSGKDRWISFVEKSHTSFATLKETFLNSNDYETKTVGHRHSPAATPIGEGIYVITSTGQGNHLAYMLTLPEKLGDAQKNIGLKKRGSFIISTRNPQFPPPKNARLPAGPEYPQKILDEFRSLRWIGTTPEHLEYANTQFLLIGESSGLEKATQPDEKDQKSGDRDDPIKEMEKLEDEDTARMEDLGEDDSSAIFADLEVTAKDYPKLQTTF